MEQEQIVIQAKEQKTKMENSHIPILQEIEKFYLFLNERFNLELPQQVVFTLAKSRGNNLGHFAIERIKNTTKTLHQINLNTINLKRDFHEDIYVTIAHEIAHYKNFFEGINDCANNGRHNKKFKFQAEKLLLKVIDKPIDFRGYSYTSTSEEFSKMLNQEFKPDYEVWNLAEIEIKRKNTKKGLRKYTCSCETIIRASQDDLKATCDLCETKFILEEN